MIELSLAEVSLLIEILKSPQIGVPIFQARIAAELFEKVKAHADHLKQLKQQAPP